MLKFLNSSFRSRGVINTVKRGFVVLKRYGITKKKFYNNLETLMNILDIFNAKATLPITATVLQRNLDILDVLDQKLIELAIHGYLHVDYTKLSSMTILKHLKQAIKIFNNNKIQPYGFRAPYLKVNKTLINAVSEVGLIYDSSYPFYFDVLSNKLKHNNNFERLISMYKNELDFIKNPTMFKITNNLYEIPVSLPDDSLLMDGFFLSPTEVYKYWVKILEKTMKIKGGIFVLQLHPERLHLLKTTLKKILNKSNELEIKITNLKDLISQYNKEDRFLVVSGDIDIIYLLDIINMRTKK